ncbi:MAG TPA: hypothetical protein DCE56_41640 [Cyanobacteria bacterium UBA8553]|nr:hypothetical protein [Cyanobacteria bacterium UBA8553]
MFSPLSLKAHKQLINLACKVQSLREQVLDSKVACLQAREACQMCNLQAADEYLEQSINNVPESKTIEELKLRVLRLQLMHTDLNLDSIRVNLTALLDEYNATLDYIEVVQEGLISLLDRRQVYHTAGVIQDFYKFEPQRITLFFDQQLTEI